MPSLTLDDKRWSTLWSRSGPAGDVPKQIAYLLDHPEDAEAFDNLADILWTDGVTWSSGFAAVPHIVEMARRLSPAQRVKQVTEMGCIVAYACLDSKNDHVMLQPYLAESYYQAVRDCLPLLAETLLCEQDQGDIESLLFSAAALKGHIRLAEVLANLDSCEHCSEIMGWT
jgi:hypothetical protein